MWKTVIKTLGNVADKMGKGMSAGIEVAKSQNGGSANTTTDITDTTVFGKALGTTVNKIKDYAKNSKEESIDETGKDEGTI